MQFDIDSPVVNKIIDKVLSKPSFHTAYKRHCKEALKAAFRETVNDFSNEDCAEIEAVISSA
jgi:predicted house-cleaning noncanonical NTP pyrophosphatase (MazG superfamily)